MWSLLGAAIHLADPDLGQDCEQGLRLVLREKCGVETAVADEIEQCFRLGRQAEPLDWQTLDLQEREPQPETEAPWTVRQAEDEPQRLFDPTAFWHTVGYLHDSGQTDRALPDPMVATGVLPAGSSAYRNLSPHRYRTPTWLAENCTGCGLCWTTCPDSALPATTQKVEQWVETAMALCKTSGHALTQMNRITTHLIKMAHQIIAKDDLRQHRTAGPLLEQAFTQLMEKMGLEGEAMEAMRAEFEQFKAMLDDWPFARTEVYFDIPNGQQAGSGSLLTIPFNPSNCKACGLCLEVCPENAFDWRDYVNEREQIDRRNWAFRMQLPDPTVARESGQKPVLTARDRLLDRDVYHTLVGGDSAIPALGSKIAVHLLTAAMDSVMKGRHQVHAEYLAGLLEQLRARIQGEVAAVVQINDFEDFSRRLEQLNGSRDGKHLAELFDAKETPNQIDQPRLQRMSKLLQALEAQYRLYKDGRRSRLMLALHPEIGLWSGYYPDNPHTNPWISNGDQDTAALAEGLFDGVAAVMAEEFVSCRQAEIELRNAFKSGESPQTLNWREFTEAELKLLPPVLMIAPSEAVHWRELGRLLSGSRPIQVALLDATGSVDGDLEQHSSAGYRPASGSSVAKLDWLSRASA